MAAASYKISRKELIRELDEQLERADVGMSADKFLESVRARRLDTSAPAISQLAVLARLINERW